MALNNSAEQSPQPHRTLGQIAKQGGLFVLFGTLLMIPRVRRLRRRVWAWTGVRLGVATCGSWLAWRFAHARAGVPTLALGLLLLAFSLLVPAKPAVKSMDALAGELGALIVLNGGIFRQSPDSTPIQQAQIFVHPEQIIVLGSRERRLLEIPLGKVRNMAAHPIAHDAGDGLAPWEVEINWVADGPCATTFQYAGAFAEHLARVTESTLRGQWMRDLPVIRQ